MVANTIYMLKIQIPKPCHEDWNTMTPTQQGAFCGGWSKEVVDFTQMTDEAVQYFFVNRISDKTCGRFRTEQVHRIQVYLPESILLQKIASWKKFMAILMLAFGSMLFGCDIGTQTNSSVVKATDSVTIQNSSDTNRLLGEVAPTMGTPVEIKIDTVSCSKELLGAVVAPPIEDVNDILQGDVSIVSADIVIKPQADTVDYNRVFTGRILLEKRDNIPIKKPASDTNKCNDTGYY